MKKTTLLLLLSFGMIKADGLQLVGKSFNSIDSVKIGSVQWIELKIKKDNIVQSKSNVILSREPGNTAVVVFKLPLATFRVDYINENRDDTASRRFYFTVPGNLMAKQFSIQADYSNREYCNVSQKKDVVTVTSTIPGQNTTTGTNTVSGTNTVMGVNTIAGPNTTPGIDTTNTGGTTGIEYYQEEIPLYTIYYDIQGVEMVTPKGLYIERRVFRNRIETKRGYILE